MASPSADVAVGVRYKSTGNRHETLGKLHVFDTCLCLSGKIFGHESRTIIPERLPGARSRGGVPHAHAIRSGSPWWERRTCELKHGLNGRSSEVGAGECCQRGRVRRECGLQGWPGQQEGRGTARHDSATLRTHARRPKHTRTHTHARTLFLHPPHTRRGQLTHAAAHTYSLWTLPLFICFWRLPPSDLHCTPLSQHAVQCSAVQCSAAALTSNDTLGAKPSHSPR